MTKEIETAQQGKDNTVEPSGEDESEPEGPAKAMHAPEKTVDAPGKEETQPDQPPELTTDLTPFPKIWEHFGLPENVQDIVRQYLQMKAGEIETLNDKMIEIIVTSVGHVLAAPIGSHIYEEKLEGIVNLVKEAQQIMSEGKDQPHGSDSTGSDESE